MPGAPATPRRWDVLLVISLGGALGSMARWGLTEHGAWGTAIVNVLGSFLLGVLLVLVVRRWPHSRYLRPFLGIGFLGGFTTFSAYMLDTRTLLVNGEPVVAFGYLFGTLLVGVAAAGLGVVAAHRLVARRTT